jgi:RNA polymerase sigma-70 factor (ECF subfamily)
VCRGFESIPEDQRLCLELAYVEGLSQREIADQTNLAVGTIKSRIRIGLEKVERLMRGSCVSDASG